MEILHFCVLASEIVMRGRTPYYAINSNRFGKPYEFDMIAGYDKNGEKIYEKRVRDGSSRKIFRIYLNELLKERCVTRIKTKDKRAKYYSITPLGICHLMKEGLFHDGLKCPWPERLHIINILQTFASPNVKPYRSLIFEGQKFFSYDFFVWDNLAEILQLDLKGLIIQIFQNFDNYRNSFSYYVYSGIDEVYKFHLATFTFSEDNVTVIELDKKSGIIIEEPDYKPLELDYEQFDHYLANLMLCSLIYDYSVLHYEYEKKQRQLQKVVRNKKAKIMHDMNNYPEYFLKIIILFSKHISKILQNRYDLLNNVRTELNQIQFASEKTITI